MGYFVAEAVTYEVTWRRREVTRESTDRASRSSTHLKDNTLTWTHEHTEHTDMNTLKWTHWHEHTEHTAFFCTKVIQVLVTHILLARQFNQTLIPNNIPIST